ncbi:hypothetical protein SFRURICE_019271, partial [Spodoptera frugiperda]
MEHNAPRLCERGRRDESPTLFCARESLGEVRPQQNSGSAIYTNFFQQCCGDAVQRCPTLSDTRSTNVPSGDEALCDLCPQLRTEQAELCRHVEMWINPPSSSASATTCLTNYLEQLQTYIHLH